MFEAIFGAPYTVWLPAGSSPGMGSARVMEALPSDVGNVALMGATESFARRLICENNRILRLTL